MKVRQKCLAGNPKTTTNSVGVSGFSLIYQRSSPDVVSRRSRSASGLCRNCINQMLTGTDLLDKVKEVGDVPKTELAKACGYVITKKDGSEQVKFTQFYEALLDAKGISLGGSSGIGKGGRKLSYKAKVQGNGNLLVGMAYTAMLDLKPGDEFTIKLSEKKGVTLSPVGAEDEE